MKSLLLIIALLGTCITTTASAHVFDRYISAARARFLPTKILQEVVAANASIAIKSTSGGPSYKPGYFYGGTIYLPYAKKAPSKWTTIEWTNFYNEAFHAWWGTVFVKNAKYKSLKSRLFSDTMLMRKYKRANPRSPKLAMEEGYSETVASTILLANPRIRVDPDTGRHVRVPYKYETLYYKKGQTISAVSHSDRPGYTAAAENIYPDEREFNYITNWIFGKDAPPIP